MAKQSVEIGQKYQAVGVGFLGRKNPLWAVETVFTSTDTLRYAQLVNLTDRSQVKTLSVAVLTDRRRYQMVEAN